MAEWYEDFAYDAKEVAKADALADRLASSGPYIGRFTRVWPVAFDKGTKAVKLEFQLEGFNGESGKTEGILFMENAEGKALFGAAFLHSLECILKTKSLGVKKGKVLAWDNGKKVEVDGERFTALEDKPIGVVWQKELTDRGTNYLISGFFDPKTKLTGSEIAAGETQPVKLSKMIKNLKDKDGRTKKTESTRPDVFSDDDSGGSLM